VSQKGAIDDTDSGFRGQFGLYPGRETAIFGDSVATAGNGDTAVSRLDLVDAYPPFANLL
jgi:hypothetical protein